MERPSLTTAQPCTKDVFPGSVEPEIPRRSGVRAAASGAVRWHLDAVEPHAPSHQPASEGDPLHAEQTLSINVLLVMITELVLMLAFGVMAIPGKVPLGIDLMLQPSIIFLYFDLILKYCNLQTHLEYKLNNCHYLIIVHFQFHGHINFLAIHTAKKFHMSNHR